jgi:hypothetical protein
LPVTKRFFTSSITSLAKGLIAVRDTLGKQISVVDTKIDKLSDSQALIGAEIHQVRTDMTTLTSSVNSINDSLLRCEAQLSSFDAKQSYTARGVRLLIACVGAIIPEGSLSNELRKFNNDNTHVDHVDHVVVQSTAAATSPPPTPVASTENTDPETQQYTPTKESPTKSDDAEVDSLEDVRRLIFAGTTVVTP